MGPGAAEGLMEDALQYFLKFYRAHALEHTHLYPGIRDAVMALSGQQHTLGVLTNKPGKISLDIINALGLGKIFSRVYGGDALPGRSRIQWAFWLSWTRVARPRVRRR